MIFLSLYKQKDQSLDWSKNFQNINCLTVTTTHDAYLDYGICIGLTVDTSIVAYPFINVNIPQ